MRVNPLSVSVASLLLCVGVSLSAAERPNILLIVADDMAHTDLGIAGHPLVKTPNLDRLAREGVRFTHVFTPNPICTPSRAALLTGQDCWTNGCYFFGMPIKESSIQFATLLSKAGYKTFYTGKWHNDGKPWTRGFASGAYHFVGGPPIETRQSKPWVVDHGGGNKRQVERFSTTLITDAALAFLDKQKRGDKPFLMFVSHKSPHDPWTPPGKYASMYPPERIELPKNFMPRPTDQHGRPYRWFTDWHGTELRDEALMPYPRTPAGVREVRSRYFGMVTQLDHQIGRLLNKLDEKRLTANTLVLFLADHGISLGAHGFSGKQTMYDEGIRLPMILRYPRVERGQATRSELVSLIDVFPTLCEAAGVPVPEAVEGKSLLGLYQGKGRWQRDRIFAAFHSPSKHRMISRAVRTKQFKYIHNLTTDEVELYDLKNDPYELTNRSGQPKYRAIEEQLAADLLAWRKKSEPEFTDN
jgi:arylsulfatase A-like enzyme